MKLRAVSHWFDQKPQRLLIIPIAFLVVFYVLPLILIVIVGLETKDGFSIARYRELFSSPVFSIIIWRTIRISAIVMLVCLILGYPYAYMLLKLGPKARAFFTFCVVAPFFTSILIRSYAWVALLADRGLVNNVLMQLGLISEPIQLVYNEIGTLIGMIQIELPLMVLTLYGTMRRIDPTLVRAVESLGAHRITGFLKVFLPLTYPGIAAGCGLVFTSTLGFYVTPALLGGPGDLVVTGSIYQRVSALGDLRGAAAESSVLLIVVVLLIVLLRQSLVRSGTGDEIDKDSSAARAPLRISKLSYFPEAVFRRIGSGTKLVSVLLQGLVICSFGFTVILLTAPLLVVFPLAFSNLPYLRFPPEGFSLQWINAYLTDEAWLESTFFSGWIGLSAALAATLVGSIAAYAMSRWSAKSKSFVEIFLVSPLLIPQFVVALAMFFIIARVGVVGNPLTFIVAYTVFGFPFVFLIMYPTFQRFDHSLIQAASILGARSLGTWRQIVIPILAPSFLSALLFAFLISFDDLVVALFFSTAETYTLPMRMWDDIRLEISPRIAAVAVVLFTGILVLMAIVELARMVVRRLRPAFGKF